ncbi:MAG: cobalamin-dependent protein, partial [Candidatus Hydrogenedentes bacterium]|nr:cobalamin-dependent protein [Candidatus Hydrogenedentota bacterium]
MKHIVMVQPREGVYDKVFKPWIPLSLLCAVSKLAIEGYTITIIDQRVSHDWESELRKALDTHPICAGITSMTGSQILGALAASRLVKEHGSVPVVWGGVHCSLFPDETIVHDDIDIIVKGEGEITFYELVKRIETERSLDGLESVWYKQDGTIKKNPDRAFIDLNDMPDTPYHLVDLNNYLHQFFNEKHVLEVESSRGCPYACAFCYNSLYSKCKWR